MAQEKEHDSHMFCLEEGHDAATCQFCHQFILKALHRGVAWLKAALCGKALGALGLQSEKYPAQHEKKSLYAIISACALHPDVRTKL